MERFGVEGWCSDGLGGVELRWVLERQEVLKAVAAAAFEALFLC